MATRRRTITLHNNTVAGIDLGSDTNIRIRAMVPAKSHGLILVHGTARQSTIDMQIEVGRGAKVHLITIAKHVKNFDCRVDVQLQSAGAEATVSGMYHGCHNDRHRFTGVMHHRARRTKGDILIRGVYEDAARGHFSGLIKIDKPAQQTLSYFTDNVLLLDQARATSVPTLEIEANDVKASHGSTTGRIDDDKLFYLTSRGLTTAQARQMVINGFFKPIVDRLQLTTFPV